MLYKQLYLNVYNQLQALFQAGGQRILVISRSREKREEEKLKTVWSKAEPAGSKR